MFERYAPMRPALVGALATALVAALAGCAGTPRAPDAGALIAEAEAALGSARLKTLVINGRGTGSTFGQAWQPGNPWPALNVSALNRSFDFEAGAYREEFARSRAEPNGGGAVPLLGQGEARAVGLFRDGFAWSPGAQPGTGNPELRFVQARTHDYWTATPHAALRAARRHGAVAGTRSVDGRTLRTLSFSAPGQLAATLVLDDAGLVTRIESTMPNPVSGDTAVVTEFGDYKEIDGMRVPMRLRQSQGAFPVLELQVTEARPNAPVEIAVPDNVRSARENVAVTPVAPGVWFLAGGSHNSVAIERSDQIVLVEAPLYDGRTLAVFETANKLVPGKTVKTVINSHHHFDHAGGLRAAAGEGAVLITSELARPCFERVFANPNRVAPDHLARSGRPVRITGVSGRAELLDALRPIEIHEMQGSVHAQGFLMVWLPRERLLIQADADTPGPPNAAPPPVPNANHVNPVQNIERLRLDVDRIVPLHSRVVPMAELLAQIGRK